jgi:hypothetical protein
MATKRTQARSDWSAPPTEGLLVLERQIREAIDEAQAIQAKPYEAGWGNWQTNLGDLIDRAFGPESPQASSFHWAGGLIADGPDARDLAASDYAIAMAQWRNEKITSYIAAARGALKAIAQELERRGAQPTATGLLRRDFAFVRSEPVRAIAIRDHEELRGVADRTIKATALLAGSVIESVLLDALGRVGFTAKQLDRMELHEMVDEAAVAKVIQPRTQKAAHAVRDVRNFVHPAVELREGRLRDVDAKAAIALMNLVLEDLA